MRLTNNTLLRGYNRSLNRLKTAKNDCENKITSQRKFARASDAPLSAAKALNVRKSLYYSEQHKENLKVASSFYTEAETSLLQVSDKMAEVREALIAAVNTTKDDTEYNIYAQQLETMARELCSIFNTDSAGRSIFGCESDDPMPFSIINDSSGFASTVLYHGVPVNSLNNYSDFPYSNRVYVDIGLGMQTDQAEHVTDSMSVLDISFNGAEITGCGAEQSVADIDLSQIKSGRLYLFDIYCDGSKKTIAFKGQGNAEENVKLINDLFAEAYKKDISYSKNYPKMDDQGIVYSVHINDDGEEEPVKGGLVSITNNTVIKEITQWNIDAGYGELNVSGKWDAKFAARTDALVIDNDSGYTDKFRLNFDALGEDTLYKVDVKYGDVTKSIEFVSGNNNGDEFAEDITIRNLQEALDAAFGEGNITVSTHEPVKGIVSAEGKRVELVAAISQEDADKANGKYDQIYGKVTVSDGTGISKLNLNSMRFKPQETESGTESTKKFKFDINGKTVEVEIDANSSRDDIVDKINAKFKAEGTNYTVDKSGLVTDDKGEAQKVVANGNTAIIGSEKNYKIDPASIKADQKYYLKFVSGNSVDTIEFTAKADGDLATLNAELAKILGGDLKVDTDGTIVSASNKAAMVSNNMELGNRAIVERERIYSNNYIQLTLDAARALRNGDIEYANGCIDKIVTANEHLLLEIADLGCNEDFIDFNIERITTREMNLYERQNDLEAADPEYMITLWKQYEAYFNACLQMSSSVIPNSIFNYMR